MPRKITVAVASDLKVGFRLGVLSASTQVEVRTGTEGYVGADSEIGTRTDTPVRDVPQSIYVTSSAVLRDQQAVRLTDATRNVSGVTFGNDSGGAL